MYTFKLIPNNQLDTIIPLLRILNDKIEVEILKERLDDMILQGYKCVGIFDNNKLIGISGLWIITRYYVGRHIEPDNVVIHPNYRNKGIGELLIKWIYEYGLANGCIASELNCYKENVKGLKFWQNQGYKILGYHLQKKPI